MRYLLLEYRAIWEKYGQPFKCKYRGQTEQTSGSNPFILVLSWGSLGSEDVVWFNKAGRPESELMMSRNMETKVLQCLKLLASNWRQNLRGHCIKETVIVVENTCFCSSGETWCTPISHSSQLSRHTSRSHWGELDAWRSGGMSWSEFAFV